ncbi:MAG: hypothetical protein H0X15_11900 [Acidobacteria bacterium]|nr:hypothetical protein [Acidobacteriota bacterium]
MTGAGGLVAGVNEVTFTNTAVGPPAATCPAGTTPFTTVSEDPSLFPGGIPSFGVTAGPNSVTVDHVNAGTGLQSLTVMNPPANAAVTMPAFTPGTFDPVTTTFAANDAAPVDFTLRATSLFHGIFVRVRCVQQ